VLHVLDLEADHRQLVHDGLERLLGIEVILEPGECEFHGTSSRQTWPWPLPGLRSRISEGVCEPPSATAISSSTTVLFFTTSRLLKRTTPQPRAGRYAPPCRVVLGSHCWSPSTGPVGLIPRPGSWAQSARERRTIERPEPVVGEPPHVGLEE